MAALMSNSDIGSGSIPTDIAPNLTAADGVAGREGRESEGAEEDR